jgi:hypothetical protein
LAPELELEHEPGICCTGSPQWLAGGVTCKTGTVGGQGGAIHRGINNIPASHLILNIQVIPELNRIHSGGNAEYPRTYLIANLIASLCPARC